jgi:CHAP domain-containing protein/putative peptidoglycan binding protein
MNYPNRIITKGESDKSIVEAVQTQLNAKGCGPIDVDGDFGSKTYKTVKLFQTRHSDQNGTPLVADGKIGSITWAVLFGADTVPVTTITSSTLLGKALLHAQSQIGVIENPPFSNRGKEVDEYLLTTDLDPASGNFPWCAAFVYWCFNKASAELGKRNPLVKTAGCLDHWSRAACPKIIAENAVNNPSLVKPGFIFIINHGSGTGHTGLVESVNGGFLTTIEGNTNNDGSRNGFGVLRLTKRKIVDINKGFLDYSNS